MRKAKVATTPQVAALECVIDASAPRKRIQAVTSQQILDEDMIIARNGAAWIGRVCPEDSRHISFYRRGKRYLLKEGEFELLRIKG